MPEFPSPSVTDDQILSAAQWNTAFRENSRELLNYFLRLHYADTPPADNTGAVIGGLKASAVTGTLRSQVTAGVGHWYDSTLYTSPLSPFGIIHLNEDDTTSAVHSAGDATHGRIDLVWIKVVEGTDTPQTVLQKGGGTLSQDIVRRGDVTIGVTEGTPAASPSAPAAPADSLVLAQVTVPAAATNLNAATYTDVRDPIAGGQAVRAGFAGVSDIPARNQAIVAADGSSAITASSSAAIIGGADHTVSGSDSTVAGGVGNTASGARTFVGGGLNNTASASRAAVVGGNNSTASAEDAAVVGGIASAATAVAAAVLGGDSNDATGVNAAVVGGQDSTASGTNSGVLASDVGIASGTNAATISADRCAAAGDRTTVFGQNTEIADDDTVGGGYSASALTPSGSNQNVTWKIQHTDGEATFGTLVLINLPAAYANDAAADADGTLPSGGIYQLTGDRTLYVKP